MGSLGEVVKVVMFFKIHFPRMDGKSLLWGSWFWCVLYILKSAPYKCYSIFNICHSKVTA
jgi:hypothetical protein